MPTGGTDFLVAAGLDAATAATVASVATTAFEGAGIGGLVGEVTGGGKGLTKGLEGGFLTGLGGGIGGAALGGVGGAAIGGAAGGALGAEVTGGNPLLAAAEGGIGSGVSSAIGGNTSLFGNSSPATGSPITGTGGGSTTAAPAAVSAAAGGGGDITQQFSDAFSSAQSGAGSAGGGSPSDFSSLSSSSSPSASTANTGLGSSAPATSTNAAQTTGTPSVSGSGSGGGSSPIINTAGLDNFNAGSSISSAAGPVSNASNIGGGSTNTIAKAFDNPTASNIFSAVGANAAPLAAGAGLIGDAVMNNKALKGENQIKQEAGQLATQGNQLQQYLQTGTLPPGLQGALDDASASAIATIKSQYAAHGMSGSSAEQDAIANVQQSIAANGANMALQLLQTGISESEGASQLYQSILKTSLSQDQELGSAIGRFATSAAGGNPGTYLNIADLQRKGA